MERVEATVERRQLESAAASYSYLRGLRLVPLGLLIILAALTNWEVGPLRHLWTFPVAALVITSASLPITRYYKEHYGRVRPSKRQQVREAVATVVSLALMIGVSLVLRSDAPWSLDLPVNSAAAAWSMVMLVTTAITLGMRKHRVIIWGSLLVVGLLPVWNGADPTNIGLLLAGLATIATGIFDHRLLARTFGSPAGLSLEARDAGA
jgi:hypothetical protein